MTSRWRFDDYEFDRWCRDRLQRFETKLDAAVARIAAARKSAHDPGDVRRGGEEWTLTAQGTGHGAPEGARATASPVTEWKPGQ